MRRLHGAPSLARATRFVVGIIVATAACARHVPPTPASPTPPPGNVDARLVRVSLGISRVAAISAIAAWQLIDRDGRVVARGDSGDRASLASADASMSIDLSGEKASAAAPPLRLATRVNGGVVSINGKRYRGELSFAPVDSGVQVVNQVQIEAYLRGVVPRELGVRGAADHAALEAQAVAARSYVVTRLGNRSRAYDVTATTSDQVYGGVDAENTAADAAVLATEGLVLSYGGRVVSAPYHSTCGGSTAEPAEIWRSRNEPFLQRVSDRIPGSDRYYCDIGPRFRWERSWRGDSLTAIVGRYLRAYAQVPAGPVGDVRDISVEGRTASGRVAAIAIETTRGRFRVQANDIRYVLRSPGGELLNSTYFSPEVLASPDGRLARLTIRGLGYGHGVGMCQWGAIGRARAGQAFRSILSTYFPGTSVARAY